MEENTNSSVLVERALKECILISIAFEGRTCQSSTKNPYAF